MKVRRTIFSFVAIAVLAGLTLFGSWNGQRFVGFRYGVFVNNSSAECPSKVVSAEDGRLTLDDGRVVELEGPAIEVMRAELKECDHRVRFDAKEQMLYTLRRVVSCGFDRPERSQLLTIPLKRVDLLQYTSRPFAAARETRSPVAK